MLDVTSDSYGNQSSSTFEPHYWPATLISDKDDPSLSLKGVK